MNPLSPAHPRWWHANLASCVPSVKKSHRCAPGFVAKRQQGVLHAAEGAPTAVSSWFYFPLCVSSSASNALNKVAVVYWKITEVCKPALYRTTDTTAAALIESGERERERQLASVDGNCSVEPTCTIVCLPLPKRAGVSMGGALPSSPKVLFFISPTASYDRTRLACQGGAKRSAVSSSVVVPRVFFSLAIPARTPLPSSIAAHGKGALIFARPDALRTSVLPCVGRGCVVECLINMYSVLWVVLHGIYRWFGAGMKLQPCC